ncbi:MAG: hypothetical protein IKY54_07465 [Muribaculaceae bacterium]|nr:hypothetical protein [Muribaculaceae bacterium]
MASDKNKQQKASDGYRRNTLLSAMNKPGDNIVVLSKELKKLAAFMHNTKSDSNKQYSEQPSIEPKEEKQDKFSTIDIFLESSGVEESSLDDIIKSEGYNSDYFALSEEIIPETTDKQIDSINSFLNAVEKGDFKKSEEQADLPDENIDNLEEEEYCRPIEESFYTESLAHIYIKQRKYERALEIIKGISLKNPEKNIYFADQIRFLEKLIINVKPE